MEDDDKVRRIVARDLGLEHLLHAIDLGAATGEPADGKYASQAWKNRN